MNNYICYSWSDAEFSWRTADFTWREACVIQKIVSEKGSGRANIHKDIYKKLTSEEKDVLIGLIVRINENGYIYNIDEKKNKNYQIKVTSKDVQLFIKELREIKLKAII